MEVLKWKCHCSLFPFHLDQCPSGSEWVNNACDLCQVGFYRTAGVHGNKCMQCPDEVITKGRGALSKEECDMTIGSKSKHLLLNTLCSHVQLYVNFHAPIMLLTDTDECPSGQEWVSRQESCVVCEPGTYRQFGVDYWCVTCPHGFTTLNSGASSKDECRGNNSNLLQSNIINYSFSIATLILFNAHLGEIYELLGCA